MARRRSEPTVADVLQKPVHTIGAEHMLYLAIARMERLGIRHLAVVDEITGRLIGVISARALLRQRASQALIIGDQIDSAASGAELATVHRQLPKLARSLLGGRRSGRADRRRHRRHHPRHPHAH